MNYFLLHDYENRKTNKYLIVLGKLNLAYLIPNLQCASAFIHSIFLSKFRLTFRNMSRYQTYVWILQSYVWTLLQ